MSDAYQATYIASWLTQITHEIYYNAALKIFLIKQEKLIFVKREKE